MKSRLLRAQQLINRVDAQETTPTLVHGKEWLEEREFVNTGKSPTKNEQFDKDGFLALPGFADVSALIESPPPERGMFIYRGDRLEELRAEEQVHGSLSRYNLPSFRELQYQLKPKIEKIIGKKLHATYAYDRYYFPGQDLEVHVDRPACEISVTVNISGNLKQPWPIWLKKPDVYENEVVVSRGRNCPAFTAPGDAVLYKGCERPHWRDPMKSNYGKWESAWRTIRGKEDDSYYHQIFIHYVMQDGVYSHCCNDYVK